MKTLTETLKLLPLYIEEQLACEKTGDIAPIPYIAGAPGIGKSAMLEKLTKKLGFNFKSSHPALMPLEMFSGIPLPDKEKMSTIWTKPEIIDFGENTVWLLDDWHLVDPAIAKYGFELFTYKKLHDFPLPKNTIIVLAGNTTKEAGAKPSLTPIINRLAILEVEPDIEGWISYATGTDVLDVINFYEIEPKPVKVHTAVISFIDKNGKNALEPENTKDPYGTIRSWTFFGKILTRYLEKEKTPDMSTILYLASAHVGKKLASDFINFFKVYHKIDVKKILETGELIKFDSDQQNAIAELYSIIVGGSNYLLNLHERKDKNLKIMFNNYVKIINNIVQTEIQGAVGISIKGLSILAQYLETKGSRDVFNKMFFDALLGKSEVKFSEKLRNLIKERAYG